MNLYFICKSQDTLKSFTLVFTIKAMVKLNLGHRNKFEIEFSKIAVVGYILQATQNWSVYVVLLRRTAKKCTRSYNARAEPLFGSLNL